MEPQSVHDTNSVEEAKKTNDGLVRNASTETTNTPTGAKQLPTEIRAWFVSLSPRERMLALGFNDSEVVAVLSQLSTASSSVLPASPEAVRVETAMERTTDRPDIDDPVDWRLLVSLDDVERTLENLRDTSQSPAATTSSVPVDQANNGLTNDPAVYIQDSGKAGSQDFTEGEFPIDQVSEENIQSIDASNAYIIRSEEAEEGGIETDTKRADARETEVVSHIESTAAVSDDYPPDPETRSLPVADAVDEAKVKSIVHNVCAMFPSTVDPNGDVDDTPFITITPSYIAKISGEDLLLAFDEIMFSSVAGEAPKFLTTPDSTGNTSWLDSLRGAAPTELPSIPLYMLLLARFQVSLHESFRNLKSDGESATVVAPAPNATKTTDERVSHNLPCASQPSQSDTGTDVVAGTSVNDCTKSTEEEDKSPDLLINDDPPASSQSVASCEQVSLIDIVEKQSEASIGPLQDQETAKSLVAPGILGDHSATCSFDDCKAASLSLLLKSASIEDSSGIIRFHLSDKLFFATSCEEAQNSVSGYEVHSASAETKEEAAPKPLNNAVADGVGEKDEEPIQVPNKNDSGWMDETVTGNPPVGSPAKKNGKKKKKKKKRKTTNSDHSVQHTNKAANKKEEAIQAPDAPTSKEAQTKPIGKEKTDEESSESKGSNAVIPKNGGSIDKNDGMAQPKGTDAGNSPEAKHEETALPSRSDAASSKGGLHVARVEGVGTTCVVVEQPQQDEPHDGASSKAKKEAPTSESIEATKDDHSTWETVEVRSRGNRKKGSDRNGNGRFSSQQSYGSNNSSNGQYGSGSKKSKAARTSATRKRNANRKVVREILSSVLDSVDEEVRRRRQARRDSTRPVVGNKWAAAVARNNGSVARNSSDREPSVKKEATTMRDVLVGRQSGNASKPQPSAPSQFAQRLHPDRGRQRSEVKNDGKHSGDGRHGNEQRKARENSEKASPGVGARSSGHAVSADQNTAPTVPETLSAVSASSLNTDAFRGLDSRRNLPVRGSVAARSDSSSGESAEVLKPLQSSTSQPGKEGSPPPPLPTLLSPGNANSATSSVASSLDAPHAVHHHHHHCFANDNENDVGYHLLDVCDRLTREMDVFMNRRTHALNIRRSERGAVLVALQECLSTLWPGRCNVEMYGSCATQLDLPSSDLDVVICGLDRPVDMVLNAPSTPQPASSQQKSNSESENKASDTDALENASNSQESHQHAQQQLPLHPQHMQMMYGHHLSLNSERVLRLAAELERQSWAVHVKAIPTASVPVIKILADPARLPGANTSGGENDWFVQHQMVPHVAATGSQQSGETSEMAGTQQPGLPRFHPSQTPPTWRGADVVNGLLKVDITFEGPEHGGIGSTEFSSRVVQEFCDETGLPPERTPAVQVLMVLKELLAQRRLNEPFSGGLSSYALLLLVISVLRERTVICQELERVERQRKMVAAGGVNSAVRGSSEDPCVPTNFRGGTMRDQKDPTEQKSKAKRQNPEDKNPKIRKLPASPHQSGQLSRPGTRKEPGDSKLNGNSSGDKKGYGPSAQGLADHSNPSSSSHGLSEIGSKMAGLPTSSWASIARKSTASPSPTPKQSHESAQANANEKPPGADTKAAPAKVSTFADAVANGAPAAMGASSGFSQSGSGSAVDKGKGASSNLAARDNDKDKGKATGDANPRKSDADGKQGDRLKKDAAPVNSNKGVDGSKPDSSSDQGGGAKNPIASASFDSGLCASPSVFPQGFHDVIEVLCSGETTAGKLLMHFLLFYGQHFDPQSTAIDYSGKHERDFSGMKPYSHLSPYMQRRTAGSYDPMTGMLTVDPIVVYDPLEGAENNNVARSCFCWSNIRWVFTQSYMTLSNAVEMSAAPTSAQSAGNRGDLGTGGHPSGITTQGKVGKEDTWKGPYSQDDGGSLIVDPSAPLLELLLSY